MSDITSISRDELFVKSIGWFADANDCYIRNLTYMSQKYDISEKNLEYFVTIMSGYPVKRGYARVVREFCTLYGVEVNDMIDLLVSYDIFLYTDRLTDREKYVVNIQEKESPDEADYMPIKEWRFNDIVV